MWCRRTGTGCPEGLLLGDVEKLPGHGPEPPALGVPPGPGVGLMDSEVPASLSHPGVLYFPHCHPLDENVGTAF